MARALVFLNTDVPDSLTLAAETELSHPIVAEELALLERTADRLREVSPPATPSEAPIVAELERIREQLISGTDRKDIGALTQQWHRQSALLAQLRTSRAAPAVDPSTPYFAHLRLRENGAERDLCLGRATFIDRGVRIVDWRNAPISRIFYRYRQGEEFEEELAGRLRAGEVVARRTVQIRNGALQAIDAPEGRFDADPTADGGWRKSERERPRLLGGETRAVRAYQVGSAEGRRLGTAGDPSGRRADKHLPEITGLIDPEQFDLISRPSSGFLVVRGTAGSGKTTVALHRVAYLAYDDPEVDSEQTLVVVFSEALRKYVSHVLPSLGLVNVRILTYPDWASEQRRRHFPNLPQAVRQQTSGLTRRAKLHPVLASALDRHIAATPGPARMEQAIDDWASVLTHRSLLADAFAREAPGAFTSDEIARFVEDNQRANEAVGAHLAGDSDAEAELDAEDDSLLLRAWQLRVGPLRRNGPRPLRYRHVAVDEVQDFSPLEVRVLLDCLDRHRSITLAGDTQQHLMEASGFTSWSDFLARLGVPGAEVETLRVAYRSTREIVAFAMALLGDLVEDEDPPETTRSGPPVELFRFTERGACITFLADALGDLAVREPMASVAILAPDADTSAVYDEGLRAAGVNGLRRVVDQDFSFSPGVEITEIEQAKGLEFDYAILVDASHENYPDSPRSRRRLHVAATRAVHQLWLTSVGTPSPLVAGLAAG